MEKDDLKLESYSRRTVWIHWLSTLLIFGLIGTGIKMEGLEVSAHKFGLYQVHFTLGMLVLLLTLIRVFALIRDKRPNSLYTKGSTMWYALEGVHYGLYGVLLWMCFSGVISLSLEGILPSLLGSQWTELPEIMADGLHPIMLSHHIVAKLLFLLLIAHVGGVILYYLRFRKNTLPRIWFR